jgi:hypothetical protein
MRPHIEVQPLPHKTRHRAFLALVLVFVVSLPFLYLYATGYRFDFQKPTNLISTGGIYVAVERAGAEIFIDGELVRETRTFRKAFYAQNLDAGTHRVHVQKEGYHTWVKELPVTKRLVTEAEAFNLPLVPQVRVITEYQSATGTPIVRTPLLFASTTNAVLATSTKATSTYTINREYETLVQNFVSTTTVIEESTTDQIKDIFKTSTTTLKSETEATSTIEYNGVRLERAGEEVTATWVGPFEQMPYYYCAPEFPAYSTSTATTSAEEVLPSEEELLVLEEGVMGPVQSVAKDTVCDARIRIDRKWQEVRDFDFYPGSTDFVILALTDGIYVVEVDDRSWQNVQPLMMGDMLNFHIENGSVYVYDGKIIYQVLLQTE